jgi:DNA-binding response OmpR family regulator
MTKILLVEDDPVIGKSLQVALELEGYSLDWATSLAEARAKEPPFDLVILDINLPDGSGLTLAKEIRPVPVLMLTASGDEESVVSGFAAGAVDYVRKPFSNKELKARIAVVLGGKGKPAQQAIQFAGVTLQKDERLVKAGEVVLDLNRREFDILACLLAHAESVVTRESLLRVLDREGEIFDRTIDSHISHLRSRLKKAGIASLQIASVYGVGYRLEKKA